MLRLPTFSYHTPKSASEAVAIAKQHGKAAMFVAGGTDLYPNMKRRHQTPEQVISLRDVPELHSRWKCSKTAGCRSARWSR